MRAVAFLIDYLIIGVIVYFALEPFYPSHQRFISQSFFWNHISDIAFVTYLLLSIMIFKRTAGMFLTKRKIETEECIIKVAILRVILLPFYILNLIWYPLRKKLLQDELTDSIVKGN